MHQRLIDQQRAEYLAVAGMMHRLYDGLPHHPRRAGGAVEAGVGAHFEDGGNAAAFFAKRVRPRIDEFDLGRGIRAVAEFVLQALDVNAVARPVGEPARHEEARQSPLRLCQNQVRIALRRREKPLMAGDAIRTISRAGRAGRVGAHIRPPLLFGHAHADQAAALMFDGDVAWVVFARDDAGHPSWLQPRVAAHRRNRSIGHRGRAERAALDLRLHQIAGRARRVRAGHAAVDPRPRPGVVAARHDALHQGVPGGMEFDRIDALPLHVEGMKYGWVAVGAPCILKGCRRAQGRPR